MRWSEKCHSTVEREGGGFVKSCAVAQSCPTLCNPMDCSPPGSSVHGILQAKIVEWVAMPSSRGTFQPKDQAQSTALQVDSLLSEPPGKPSDG